MRKVILLLIIAVIHVVLTIVCGVAEYSTSWFLFSPPSSTHGFWSVALKVVEFPLLAIIRAQAPKHLPFYSYVMVLNSFLWATVIVIGIRLCRNRFCGCIASISRFQFNFFQQ